MAEHSIRGYLNVIAGFIVMVCLGSIYAWSIMAAELTKEYALLATQTQMIFGTFIAVFPVTMIVADKLERKIGARKTVFLSALLLIAGQGLAGLSNGNFYLIYGGIGLLAAAATGLGYLVSLTVPVKWFPQHKGLVTGISTAGFGFGAMVYSFAVEYLLMHNYRVSEIFVLLGLIYGIVIFLAAIGFQDAQEDKDQPMSVPNRLHSHPMFRRLFLGIFFGTFAGLMIVGSLKIIGSPYSISNHELILGVSLFSVSNFLGRIFWGFVSDRIGPALCVFWALSIQGMAIYLISAMELNAWSYLVLSSAIGFGFGGNFVLFAKQTALTYGVSQLGQVYPHVFLGYALAGLLGPFSGGVLMDWTGHFFYSGVLATVMSLIGGLIFLHYWKQSGRNRKMTVTE